MRYLIEQNTINKLPPISIQGLSGDENKYVNEWIKYLLQYAKDCNQSNEVGIILDMSNWNDYDTVLGTAHSVKFNTSKMKDWLDNGNNNLILLHNHPSNSIFSDKDIFNFCKSLAVNTLIVVGNKGNIYLIQKLRGFDKNKLILYYSDETDKLKYHHTRSEILETVLHEYQGELGIYFEKEVTIC